LLCQKNIQLAIKWLSNRMCLLIQRPSMLETG
jgi:hypothetical protein